MIDFFPVAVNILTNVFTKVVNLISFSVRFFKTDNFWGCFQNSYWFLYKPDKTNVAFKRTNNNDVTRQEAKCVGDSYNSKTTHFKYVTIHIILVSPLWGMCRARAKLIWISISPRVRVPAVHELQCLGITIKHDFQVRCPRLPFCISLGRRNNSFFF